MFMIQIAVPRNKDLHLILYVLSTQLSISRWNYLTYYLLPNMISKVKEL